MVVAEEMIKFFFISVSDESQTPKLVLGMEAPTSTMPILSQNSVF